MWRKIIIAATLGGLASCQASGAWTPRYHGALSTTHWEALTPRPRATSSTAVTSTQDDVTCDLRKQMIDGALAIYDKGAPANDFGQNDLQRLFEQNEIRTGWKARRGLESLVETARRKDAFHLDSDITPGDIVFFHNVADRNHNGQNDDWLGAAGIAVRQEGDVVEAVLRTQNAPRKIVLMPTGPGVRTLDKRVVNSYLRVPSRSDPPETDYLAGRLYAGYIDLDSFVGSQRCLKKENEETTSR